MCLLVWNDLQYWIFLKITPQIVFININIYQSYHYQLVSIFTQVTVYNRNIGYYKKSRCLERLKRSISYSKLIFEVIVEIYVHGFNFAFGRNRMESQEMESILRLQWKLIMKGSLKVAKRVRLITSCGWMRPQAESGFAVGISRAKHCMLYYFAQGYPLVKGYCY